MKDSVIEWEYPDNLEYGGSLPSKGKNWFFILTTARTGSTILTKILNLHEEVYCGNEENVLHLLSVIYKSKKIFYKGRKPRLRYYPQTSKQLSLKGLRTMMEAWRKTQSSARFFGDKDWLYGEEYSDLVDKVFPENRKILTVRNLLDQLSSLYKQKWHDGLPSNKDQQYLQILKDIEYRMTYNAKWRREADLVIKFEDFGNTEKIRDTLYRTFDLLGADRKRVDIEKAVSLCRHKQSIDRWKKDKLIMNFIGRLEKENNELAKKLKQEGCYW